MKIFKMIYDVSKYIENAIRAVAVRVEITEALNREDYDEALEQANLCYASVFENYQILRRRGWGTKDEERTLESLSEEINQLTNQLNSTEIKK